MERKAQQPLREITLNHHQEHNRSHVATTKHEKEQLQKIGEHLYEGGIEGDMNSEEHLDEGVKANLGQGMHHHAQSMQLPYNNGMQRKASKKMIGPQSNYQTS